jgi:hypothetical protein
MVMDIKLTVNKNNTAILNTGKHEIELSPEYRLDKDTKFNKYLVRDGKAIFKVYAVPNKQQTVILRQIGDSKNAHKFEAIKTDKLIVSDGYLAKTGHKIQLS